MKIYKNLLLTQDNVLFNFNDFSINILDSKHLVIFEKLLNKKIEEKNTPFIFNNKTIKNTYNIKVLKIHTADTCNLACKYCYAKEGTYNNNKKFIDNNTIKNIEKISNILFSELETISFFGGEAFLNIDAIKLICKKFKDKEINFLAQTNGTTLNNEVVDVINKYKIKCTISIDGNKEVHDKNRIYKNGEGTFNDIKKNIEKIGDNFISIQATRTDSKLTFEELYDYLFNTFKVQNIVINNNIFQPELNEDKSNAYDDIKGILEKDFIKPTYATHLINDFFSNKTSRYYCQAGNNILSIDTDGNIYPCQFFIDQIKNFSLGNVNTFDYKTFLNSTQKFCELIDKRKRKECEECFLQWQCSKCYASNNKIDYNNCSNKREYAKIVFNELAKIILNNELDYLLNKMSALIVLDN